MENSLEEEILKLYREPGIGASYQNTYGEMNISNLIGKYRQLCSEEMQQMRDLVTLYSTSYDLMSSFVSVGVLHALGMNDEVEEAYHWAGTQEDAEKIISHFDIGKSLAEHFASG